MYGISIQWDLSESLSLKFPTLCDPTDCHGILPNPGIEPRSPALQANSLPTELSGKPSMGSYSALKMNEF